MILAIHQALVSLMHASYLVTYFLSMAVAALLKEWQLTSRISIFETAISASGLILSSFAVWQLTESTFHFETVFH